MAGREKERDEINCCMGICFYTRTHTGIQGYGKKKNKQKKGEKKNPSRNERRDKTVSKVTRSEEREKGSKLCGN